MSVYPFSVRALHLPDDIFPLPMVAFERYMLADDRSEYPMTFVMAVRLTGEVERADMEESLRETLVVHPLLRAVIDNKDARRPCWVSAGENAVTFDWQRAAASLQCPDGGAIDLQLQPGLRAWARQGEGSVELTFQFHHACCDGIGAMCFIGDVLGAYARRTATSSDGPLVHAVDVRRRLRERAVLGRHESMPGRLAALLRTLPLTVKFVALRPRALESRRTNSEEPPAPLPFPDIKQAVLSEDASMQLREAAHRQGVSLNDLLLRDMFLTVDDWNRRAGVSPGWLRVLMPTNLRLPRDEDMPAANLVSLSFITRHSHECRQPRELLAGIRRETDSIKRMRRGLYFIRVIEAAQTLCGKMPRLLVGNRCRASVVLSNMGDLGHWFAKTFPLCKGQVAVGNLTIERIVSAPPIRPNTTAAFMIHTYAGRLNVHLVCDRRVFSSDEAEELLCEYMARSKSSATCQSSNSATQQRK